MHFVYILFLSNRQLYVGLTNDLTKRLKQHKQGKSPFTKYRLPLRLIFYEVFSNKLDAQRRERYLKTSKGKSTLRMMLRFALK